MKTVELEFIDYSLYSSYDNTSISIYDDVESSEMHDV